MMKLVSEYSPQVTALITKLEEMATVRKIQITSNVPLEKQLGVIIMDQLLTDINQELNKVLASAIPVNVTIEKEPNDIFTASPAQYLNQIKTAAVNTYRKQLSNDCGFDSSDLYQWKSQGYIGYVVGFDLDDGATGYMNLLNEEGDDCSNNYVLVDLGCLTKVENANE